MASDPDPDRLRALDERIAKLKGAPKKTGQSTAKGFSQGEVAWRMVIELATGIAVGTGIGYGLDRLFGTLPVFLVILSLCGFAAGVRTMMGTAREVEEKRVAEAARHDGAAPGAPSDDNGAASAAGREG
ncbi:AtpZ/AtpI family protein [Pseudogemmobacter sonorensis]|uniref:AtpZ/AtpI family protein n=1 Tax=Pseudogemmobacter sonorensis TaxID=2989681 RepID=UPI0036C8630F